MLRLFFNLRGFLIAVSIFTARLRIRWDFQGIFVRRLCPGWLLCFLNAGLRLRIDGFPFVGEHKISGICVRFCHGIGQQPEGSQLA